ncbi:MAG: amidohydrolase family protein [Gemmatimonadota bacterium]|nr:amidohydrolase family protein [Gemmatimonadota bacterium]
MRRAAAALVVAAATAETAGAQIAITHVTVIDVAGAHSRRDMTVVVHGDRITAVGRSTQVRIPPGARAVDGTGQYLVPGFWDMHVHFMNTGESALPVLVAHGVTSVREMGGKIADTRAWQAGMAAGTLVGPRIRTAGPVLESPQYIARVRVRDQRLGGRLAPLVLPYRIGVGDAVQARRAVDSIDKLRADFVKVRTAGSREAYFGILAAARRAGLTVAGHAPTVVSLREASDSGQRSFEHSIIEQVTRIPAAARPALYARLAANGTCYVPTLLALSAPRTPDTVVVAMLDDTLALRDARRRLLSPSLAEWWRIQVAERLQDTAAARRFAGAWRSGYDGTLAIIRAMRAAGVPILVGTDAGSVMVFPGSSVHEEMALLVEDARLTPREALWGATLGPARYFGMERDLGTIEVGKLADLVLLDGDPLADIRNTSKINAVVLRGELIDAAGRRRLLDDVARGAAR